MLKQSFIDLLFNGICALDGANKSELVSVEFMWFADSFVCNWELVVSSRSSKIRILKNV